MSTLSFSFFCHLPLSTTHTHTDASTQRASSKPNRAQLFCYEARQFLPLTDGFCLFRFFLQAGLYEWANVERIANHAERLIHAEAKRIAKRRNMISIFIHFFSSCFYLTLCLPSIGTNCAVGIAFEYAFDEILCEHGSLRGSEREGRQSGWEGERDWDFHIHLHTFPEKRNNFWIDSVKKIIGYIEFYLLITCM